MTDILYILTPTPFILHFQNYIHNIAPFFFLFVIHYGCFFSPNLFYVDTEVIPPPPPIKGVPLYSAEQRPGELLE